MQLQQLFLEEFADLLSDLERSQLELRRLETNEDPSAAEKVRVEVHRVAHTLKGAARAVGQAEVEAICHALESALGPARSGTSSAPITSELQAAMPRLKAALARARVELEVQSPPSHSVGTNAVDGTVTTVEAATSSTRRATDPEETIRVPLTTVASLVGASQELLALTVQMELGDRQLEDEHHIIELRDRIGRAARIARARAEIRGLIDDELTATLESALEMARGVTSLVRNERLQQKRMLNSVRSSVSRVAAGSRSLRVRRISRLAEAIELAAREAASSLGKELMFELKGDSLEVDRRVLDGLREPLLHLVRNAVDHGIEPTAERVSTGKDRAGKIEVEATISGSELVLEISDDGRGISTEQLRVRARELGFQLARDATPREVLGLLFEPGFSTRKEITTLSGRGLGLDIVRQRIGELHGRIQIESKEGSGTRFEIIVPTDLSMMRGLVTRVRDAHVVIPSSTITRVTRAADRELIVLEGRLHIQEDGVPLPLADLDALLGFPPRASVEGRRAVVLLSVADKRFGLRVDALAEEREVGVQPLAVRIKRLPLVSGGVLLGDGSLALLLDVSDAARIARPTRAEDRTNVRSRTRRVLVVDDSVTTRQLERVLLESAGYEVELAADGADAWVRLSSGEEFDAVVSDLEMPRLDGFQLLTRIRSTPRLSKLPVVLVTALASDHDRQRAIDFGASAYLTKGAFDEDHLLSALEDLL